MMASSMRRSFKLRVSDCGIVDDNVKDHCRMAVRQAINHGKHETRSKRSRRTDLHLARIGVGQMFDLLHALAQLVEHRVTTVQQGPAIVVVARRPGGSARTGGPRERVPDR